MKRKGRGRSRGGEKELITDDRFAAAQSDPRFMGSAVKRSKVEIDSRFSGVFSDAKFASSKASVDKRGKPKSKKETGASLNHYYRLQSKEKERKLLSFDEKEEAESSSESEREGDRLDETSDNDEEQMDDSSASSSTESDDDYSNDGEEDLFVPQEDNVPSIDKETKRLAVVNLDWGQVRAVDIFVLLSSFLPKGGKIWSVSIYPSEFGIQRMKEEELHGPVSLFDGDDENDDEPADEVKLRAYELSRLRYYYAVVECDSIATADYIYRTCDGVEFERSANKLDLRFIPDSMNFEHEPRDIAKEAPANYEGVEFQTRALQHSKIDLTWDDDELQRKKTFKKKLNEKQLAELELKEYLASDESETDDGNDVADDTHNESSQKRDKKIEKYRALLESQDGLDDDHQERDQDLEVTFNFGLEDISKRISEKKERESETVWEAYLRKKKEKKKMKAINRSKNHSDDDSNAEEEFRKQSDDFFIDEPSDDDAKKEKTKKRNSEREQHREAEASVAELELLTADDNALDTRVKGYNLKAKKSKGKKGKKGETTNDEEKIPSVDYDDPRFSALFTSPLFALDPTDPQFKRSAAYARQVTKKSSKKDTSQADCPETSPASNNESASLPSGTSFPSNGKDKDEIAASVKSLKMRLKQLASAPKAKVISKSKHL